MLRAPSPPKIFLEPPASPSPQTSGLSMCGNTSKDPRRNGNSAGFGGGGPLYCYRCHQVIAHAPEQSMPPHLPCFCAMFTEKSICCLKAFHQFISTLPSLALTLCAIPDAIPDRFGYQVRFGNHFDHISVHREEYEALKRELHMLCARYKEMWVNGSFFSDRYPLEVKFAD